MPKSSSRHDPIPALEWIAAAFGLLVFLALSAVLVREAATSGGDDVPRLSAQVEAVHPVGDRYVAQIIITNASGQTAAAVQVEGKLGDETASATLDYVPGHSTARGGLMLKSDPRVGLELSVVGYELP